MNGISLPRTVKIYYLDQEIDNILKTRIMSIAKEIVTNFVLSDDLKEIFGHLFIYFTGNDGKYDLNKGIYLYGKFGIGKTVAMKIFSKFLQQNFNFGPNNFGITSIEEIAEYYKENGNLFKFGRNWEEGKMIAHNKCINEFGKPLEEKHYGTNIQNVINSMLMVRYELFQERKAITHATSNFHPGDLECFDDALLDRFKEMFNFIELKGDNFRK
jgi:predicted ATPase